MSSRVRRRSYRGNTQPRRKAVQDDWASFSRDKPTRTGHLVVHMQRTLPITAIAIRSMVMVCMLVSVIMHQRMLM